MNNITCTIRNISFGYGPTSVLDQLELTFAPGQVHAIIGPNGSGKSTLLDLMTGHLGPVSGDIYFNDTPISAFNAMDKARLVTMVPQEFDFNFPFTVFDAVLMGRHPYIPRFSRPSTDDLALVHQGLKTMDLTKLADRPLSALSGGEKQRTVVARALVQATPCLLLDEPTSSMDIRHALATLSELRSLAHAFGRTVITVLHDLNLAAAYCDTVSILDAGRLHTHGTPQKALTQDTIRAVFGVNAFVEKRDGEKHPVITYDSKELS